MTAEGSELLKLVGLSRESLERVKLGRGVVGKTTWALLSIIALLAIVASRVSVDWMLLLISGAGIVLFIVYLFKVLAFADKHPDLALLEGAELVKWRQMDVAAKGAGTLPSGPLVQPPPLLESIKDEPDTE